VVPGDAGDRCRRFPPDQVSKGIPGTTQEVGGCDTEGVARPKVIVVFLPPLPLGALKQLKYLSLGDCKRVTDAGVADLKKALPELKISR